MSVAVRTTFQIRTSDIDPWKLRSVDELIVCPASLPMNMGIVGECDADVAPMFAFVALFTNTPSTYNDTVPVDDVYVAAI